RLEIPGRGDRKAGLDHVDPEPRELLRDLDLLLRVQRDPGRLLAVPQRRIEDVDPLLVGYRSGAAHVPFLLLVETRMTLSVAATRRPALLPPQGEEKEKRGALGLRGHRVQGL